MSSISVLAAFSFAYLLGSNLGSYYIESFDLLKRYQFYDAWCALEKTEKGLWSIKTPQTYLPENWDKLWKFGKFDFIEKYTAKWQTIFPYEWFVSPGMQYREYCSVCEKLILPYKPCEHKDGEIYDGEARIRVIRDIEIDHIALVKEPANRFCVLFLHDPETGEQIDQYDYILISGLIDNLEHLFQEWNYEIQKIECDHQYFKDRGIGDKSKCPCGSQKEYQLCCINKTIVRNHYQFTMFHP